jgi:hypothetical protein
MPSFSYQKETVTTSKDESFLLHSFFIIRVTQLILKLFQLHCCEPFKASQYLSPQTQSQGAATNARSSIAKINVTMAQVRKSLHSFTATNFIS